MPVPKPLIIPSNKNHGQTTALQKTKVKQQASFRIVIIQTVTIHTERMQVITAVVFPDTFRC